MKDKLLRIISFYGINHQQRKLNEEVFELQEAITRYEDDYYYMCEPEGLDIAKEHITEELADVMVLIEQIKYYYELDSERIKKIMEEKIARQLERMKNE